MIVARVKEDGTLLGGLAETEMGRERGAHTHAWMTQGMF